MSRNGFAVHLFAGVDENGVSDEWTVEAATLDEALERIRQATLKCPEFKLVTLIHIEDLPALMMGSVVAHGGDQ